MAEFETGLPSIRQLQTLVKDKKKVEFKLVTGDTVTGKILWQDTICICLKDESEQVTTLWKQAIAYHQPKE